MLPTSTPGSCESLYVGIPIDVRRHSGGDWRDPMDKYYYILLQYSIPSTPQRILKLQVQMILQMYMSHGKNHREEDLKKYGKKAVLLTFAIAFDGFSQRNGVDGGPYPTLFLGH